MVDLDRLRPVDDDGRLHAIIELPQGSRNKLKWDVAAGTFRVTDSLPAGMSFPFDFGFIPGTKAEDGDPEDVLILMDAPAYPGCLVTITLLGVIEAEQPRGRSIASSPRSAAARRRRAATEPSPPGQRRAISEATTAS